MTASRCSGPNCSRATVARGLCDAHYRQDRRGVDLFPIGEGRTFARKSALPAICTVPGCSTPASRGEGWCRLHYDHWKAYGDPAITPRMPQGREHWNYRTGSAIYCSRHLRLVKVRGSARMYPCVDCGNPAHEWSYEGGCPDEEWTLTGMTCLVPSCPHLDCYRARCRSCHRLYDSPKGDRIRRWPPIRTDQKAG